MPEENKSGSSLQLPDVAAMSEQAEKQVRELTDKANELVCKVTDAVDTAVGAAGSAVASGRREVQQDLAWAKDRASQFYDTGVAHLQSTEDQVFGYLKEGVDVVVAHKDEALVGGLVATALLLPGPRRFLYRRTLGRFRSQEAVFRSAELKAAQLGEKLEGQAGEVVKLNERLTAARTEYERGLSKLKAAGSELEALQRRVAGTERAAKCLVSDLRTLPSKAALSLRSDVAGKAATAAGQRTAIERMVKQLVKQGLA